MATHRLERDLLDTTGHSHAGPVWRLHGHDGPRLALIRLRCTDDASTGFHPATPVPGPEPTPTADSADAA